MYWRAFSRYVFSDLRPLGGVGCPAGVAIVDACAGGCVLGSERKVERPEEHMPPRIRRKLPSMKFLLPRGEIRDQRATYSTAACVICTAAVADVMELHMYVLSTMIRTVRPTYSIYYSSSSESCVCVCSLQQKNM